MINEFKSKTAALLLAAMMLPLASCGDKGGDTGDKPTPAETAATTEPEEEEIVLPAKYSLVDDGKITKVKNQHQSGMCWAYATTAAAESSLIVSGYEDSSVDLSEAHVCYAMYPFIEDRPEGSPEDGLYAAGEKKKNKLLPYYAGGGSIFAALLFANGAGPVYEADAPLSTDAGELAKSVDNIFKLEEEGKLTKYMGSYLLTDMKQHSSNEDIKRAILSDGAVVAAVITGGTESAKGAGKDANDGNTTYYCHDRESTSEETDHVFTIVGWDDSYSKDNFSIKPKNDGAWLIKDSAMLQGATGYVWMSYEEYHDGDFSMKFAKREDYGEVLTYDHLSPLDTIKTDGEFTTIANVFKSDKANHVKGIGIYYNAPDQKINISIYKNPEKDKPDSGEKVYEKDIVMGTSGESGYSVAELDEAVAVDSGDTFSIVLKYTNTEDVDMGAPVEGDQSPYDTGAMGEFYVTSNEGESYALSGDTWYDLSKNESSSVFAKTGKINNACIKALMAK